MSSQKTPNILVVEDQLNWRRLLKVWLNKEFHLAFCTNRSEVIFALKNGYYDVVIMDLGLPDPKEGIEITQEIMKQHNDCKIIVVSAYTDRELLLKVQKISGEDFSVLGSSETARNLHETAKNVSSSDLPVLIKGPTGSGKNYLARYIHQLSPRANKPFVTINCANLSPSLAENELFGHVRGAFTGADRSAKGKFKAADGGTVLLDEVGDLSLSIQAKLLQVIEERSFFPLGGRDKIEVDIRILACTTHDLTEEVENENFRKDLYFRLAGFLINIPTISERKEDIPVYFDYFVRTVCTKENIPTPEIDQQIYDILEKMTWKGNLRELKNLITNILVFHPQKITVQDILSKQNNEKSSIISKSLQRDYSLQEMSALYAQELYKKYQKKGIIAGILNIDHKTLNRYLKMKVGP
ncbi:MAG: sigma-54 dependent transcriptional regulator [Calditrichota bacterium]